MILSKKSLLVLVALFLPILSIHAQENTLNNKIGVNYNQVKLVDVLHDLENKYGLEFAYAVDQLPLDKKVTLFAKDKKVADVLNLLFEDLGVTYHFVDNKIVLKQKRQSRSKEYPSMVSLSGFIKEKGSLENLPGASVYIPALRQGVIANNYGFYSITVPAGDYELEFSFVGFIKSVQKLSLHKSQKLDVDLEASNVLQEAVVVGNKESQKITEATQMSTVSVPIGQLQNVPTLLGEKDVFRVVQLFPGVQKATEVSSGFYVRGGTPDQNLVILDDAVVYNASHLFGFFSPFNSDALKSIELIKGGFPARFGERLSSVTVLNMKDGNKEALRGEAGIGLLSSRVVLEGPIQKGKSSFLLAGRRTYLDALMRPFRSIEEGIGGAYFYDLNAKYNVHINESNRFYLSGYFGRDKFYGAHEKNDSKSDANFSWGNATLTARWNHVFGERAFGNTSFIYSSYDFGAKGSYKTSESSMSSGIYSSIKDIGGKIDIDYSLNSNHFIRTGIRVVSHQFKPSGSFLKLNTGSTSAEEKYDSFETNLFLEDDYKISNQFQINAGLRASSFVTGAQNYMNLEPRFSVRWMLGHDFAVKASYARMNQYIHLLASTGAMSLPTDVWIPSTNSVCPMRSDQFVLGVVKDLSEHNLTLSLEGYYKKMNNLLSYKDGASFISKSFGDHSSIIGPEFAKSLSSGDIRSFWESGVTAGQGASYGVELLIQRKIGKLSGWLGYTLSWTKYQFDELSFGKAFYPKQDRRHDISLVGIYMPSPKIRFSATWVLSSGAPMDVARAEYVVQAPPGPLATVSQKAIDYGEKSSFRGDSYHRLDFAAQFIKKKGRGERIWELGVYNVYNNVNPLVYYKEESNDNVTLNKGSLFNIIPSITYTRKF